MKKQNKSIIISSVILCVLLSLVLTFAIGTNVIAVAETEIGESVYLGGKAIGLKLPLGCVEITGFRTIITKSGNVSPAADAGISIGDKIVEVNGKTVLNNKHLFEQVEKSDGEIILKIKRGKKELEKTILPAVESGSGEKKIGVFIKDEIDGIGTLTFVTKEGDFGALGHGVSGSENSQNGTVYNVVLTGVQKPKDGTVGELDGYISGAKIGTVSLINKYGVYGKIDGMTGNAVKIGGRASATIGKASIICTIDENGPKEYSVEIVKTEYQKSPGEKGLVIKITDPRLKEKTGGIVQGMSGSPIVQNGKLIGAVSHVFVSDPLRGYGVYIDWMLQ